MSETMTGGDDAQKQSLELQRIEGVRQDFKDLLYNENSVPEHDDEISLKMLLRLPPDYTMEQVKESVKACTAIWEELPTRVKDSERTRKILKILNGRAINKIYDKTVPQKPEDVTPESPELSEGLPENTVNQDMEADMPEASFRKPIGRAEKAVGKAIDINNSLDTTIRQKYKDVRERIKPGSVYGADPDKKIDDTIPDPSESVATGVSDDKFIENIGNAESEKNPTTRSNIESLLSNSSKDIPDPEDLETAVELLDLTDRFDLDELYSKFESAINAISEMPTDDEQSRGRSRDVGAYLIEIRNNLRNDVKEREMLDRMEEQDQTKPEYKFIDKPKETDELSELNSQNEPEEPKKIEEEEIKPEGVEFEGPKFKFGERVKIKNEKGKIEEDWLVYKQNEESGKVTLRKPNMQAENHYFDQKLIDAEELAEANKPDDVTQEEATEEQTPQTEQKDESEPVQEEQPEQEGATPTEAEAQASELDTTRFPALKYLEQKQAEVDKEIEQNKGKTIGRLLDLYKRNSSARIVSGVITAALAGALPGSEAVHLGRIAVAALGGATAGEAIAIKKSESGISEVLKQCKRNEDGSLDQQSLDETLKGLDKDKMIELYAQMTETASAKGLKIDTFLMQQEKKNYEEAMANRNGWFVKNLDKLRDKYNGLSKWGKVGATAATVIAGTLMAGAVGGGTLGVALAGGLQMGMGAVRSTRETHKEAYEYSDVVEKLRYQLCIRADYTPEDVHKIEQAQSKVAKGRRNWAIGGAILGGVAAEAIYQKTHSGEQGQESNQDDGRLVPRTKESIVIKEPQTSSNSFDNGIEHGYNNHSNVEPEQETVTVREITPPHQATNIENSDAHLTKDMPATPSENQGSDWAANMAKNNQSGDGAVPGGFDLDNAPKVDEVPEGSIATDQSGDGKISADQKTASSPWDEKISKLDHDSHSLDAEKVLAGGKISGDGEKFMGKIYDGLAGKNDLPSGVDQEKLLHDMSEKAKEIGIIDSSGQLTDSINDPDFDPQKFVEAVANHDQNYLDKLHDEIGIVQPESSISNASEQAVSEPTTPDIGMAQSSESAAGSQSSELNGFPAAEKATFDNALASNKDQIDRVLNDRKYLEPEVSDTVRRLMREGRLHGYDDIRISEDGSQIKLHIDGGTGTEKFVGHELKQPFQAEAPKRGFWDFLFGGNKQEQPVNKPFDAMENAGLAEETPSTPETPIEDNASEKIQDNPSPALETQNFDANMQEVQKTPQGVAPEEMKKE